MTTNPAYFMTLSFQITARSQTERGTLHQPLDASPVSGRGPQREKDVELMATRLKCLHEF
jgi:hypothetical protein